MRSDEGGGGDKGWVGGAKSLWLTGSSVRLLDHGRTIAYALTRRGIVNWKAGRWERLEKKRRGRFRSYQTSPRETNGGTYTLRGTALVRRNTFLFTQALLRLKVEGGLADRNANQRNEFEASSQRSVHCNRSERGSKRIRDNRPLQHSWEIGPLCTYLNLYFIANRSYIPPVEPQTQANKPTVTYQNDRICVLQKPYSNFRKYPIVCSQYSITILDNSIRLEISCFSLCFSTD